VPLHKKLFKLNSDGKTIQMWEIYYAVDNKSYWTVSGQLKGKKTTSSPTAVKAKVNRTQLEQVVLEMDAKATLKERTRYVTDIKHVGAKAEAALPGYSAMLAKKWENQKKKIKFPCIVQPKLDGVRCLATKDGLFTRGRKPIEACQHVRDELKPFFDAHPEAMLDGELYTHEFKDDFETIIKAVRKSGKHATEKDFKLQRKVQYHVYDSPRIDGMTASQPFVNRFAKVTSLLRGMPDCIRVVETIPIDDEFALSEWHAEFLIKGYEGTMVRNRDMPYEGKRSNNLLKMKEFDDDEFEIVDVLEGRGKLVGHAAKFVLKNAEGTEFRAKLEGSHDRLKWIYENPSSVIGMLCTVMYQGLTNKENVPRFPVAKSVRGLKDRSDWL